ncbi:hypothetical protein FRC07_006373, partial [Ceratobasidium sp. 392]
GLVTSLAYVASVAPNIRKIEIYPGYPGSEGLTDSQSIENIPEQTFASLCNLSDLRSLVVNVAVFQPYALQLIAQLPRLADLWIKAGYCGPYCGLLLQHKLPAGSFPSLVTFHIDFEVPREVKRCWDLIPLAMLTEVHIFIHSANGEDQSMFIPSLCHVSPLIRELVLDFAKPGEDEPIHIIQAEMFDYLRRLPLDRVFSVTPAKVDVDDPWDKIAASWPRLKEVRCLYQPMLLEGFMMLSENLPNLHRLECDLDMVDMADAVERGWKPVGHPPFYLNLSELTIWPLELKTWAASDIPNDLNDMAR